MTRASSAATGFSDSFGVTSLRPAEMRQQDHPAALVGNSVMVGADALEPRGVGDAAVFHGNVEVDAQQHALALHVDVIEGAEDLTCDASFPVLRRGLVPGPIHAFFVAEDVDGRATSPAMTELDC